METKLRKTNSPSQVRPSFEKQIPAKIIGQLKETRLKIIFGVIVCLLLSSLIMCIILLPGRVPNPDDNPRALTLEDYLNGKFQYKTYFPYWISSHEYLHQSTEDNVILYDVETEDSTTILTNDTLRKVNASNYALSADKQFIVLESDYTKLWRYSYTASYHIYDLQYSNFVTEHPLPHKIQYISWSPVGHKLAYVYQNNIYLKQYPEDPAIKITSNGKKNVIFNGIPDWVYEEEMLAVKYALWWSPNGKFIAYVEFNDTDIPVIEYSYYGEDQYPRKITIPYPKFFVSTPYFTSDTTSYYKIFSDKAGYKHIHYINGSVENAIPITNGQWEAIYIFKVTDDAIFYSSNEFEGYPGRRNIYKISIGSNPLRKQCITCNLRKERCQYYTARFSENAKYYALVCYGPGIPISTLFDSSNDREIKVLEANLELESAMENIKMPKIDINKLEVDGLTLWYKMLLPPQFDRSKKYPLLIQVYGGPCSQNVKHTFGISWITYLASREEIIVALVDGRGTAFQGDKMLHAVYRKLGVYEIEDQISAAKKFIEMGFVDEKRIAIWGWSYGGYVTSLALGSGSGVFKCGMAVAPVSSWEYYASIYTERFMGLPTESDNLERYKNSTVMARAENFRNVKYLLIHGTADDNVHFQNSAQISKALVNAQVDFQSMWYTDQDHGIPGLSSKHLYTHMTHFLKQCFSLSE
ncbi:prolyl endopeptidase FAP isoform X7 [Dermochelys coriacea]|uniref:prolyl endopeptidase FAP isoform X7 n=1 Tax=Dermochelys coriacea TaxID=27794 RepID=UPI001CA8A2DC|nr:prolyl endopeptidase FAP isoform X7 [Dermochelys coriacea]